MFPIDLIQALKQFEPSVINVMSPQYNSDFEKFTANNLRNEYRKS